jgi:hypothetical protein
MTHPLRSHPLLWGGQAPADMVFVVDPPGSIGEVIGAWTNLRPEGTAPIPWSLRAMDVGLWALSGLVLGLVGVFAIGGWIESRHGHFEADWFLHALGIGTGLGALVGGVRAMRAANVLTLFVGERGCVQIAGRGADAKHELLLFDDVVSFRTELDVMRHQGITTAARLVYVTKRGKKEALWYLSVPASQAKPDDPQFHYIECVLRAFDARRKH